MSMWALVYDWLKDQYPQLAASEKTVFQFPTGPMKADWYEDTPYKSWIIADTAPNELGQFYTPSSIQISSAFGSFLENLKSPPSEAVASFNDKKKNWQAITLTGGGGNREVPNLSISPDLGDRLSHWKSTKKKGLLGDLVPTISMSVFSFLLNGRDSVKSKDIKRNWDSSITFGAIELFGIIRGNWWSGDLLETHWQGPYSNRNETGKTFFGEEGSLKLIPTQILVCYDVGVRITMPKKDFQEFGGELQGDRGILVGPWQVGGKDCFEIEENVFNNKYSIISLWQADKGPWIVGVISSKNYYVIK